MRAALVAILLFAGSADAQNLRPVARPRAGFNLALTSVNYDADTQAYFNAVGMPTDMGQAQRFDAMVRCLKSGNGTPANAVWNTKLGALFAIASWSQTAGLTDVLHPTHVATLVNSPVFTVNRGVQLDGSSSYIDLADTYGSSQSLCTQNDCVIGGWTPVGPGKGSGRIVGAATAAGSYTTATTGARGAKVISTGASSNFSVANSTSAHVTGVRTNSTGFRTYDGGASLGDTSAASSSSPLNIAIYAGRSASTYSSGTMAMVYYGGGLWTDANAAVMDACTRPYLTYIGAIS